jgi:hypothetical protein
MVVPPSNRPAVPRDWYRGVPERYVAGADTRGRPEGRPYPGSQQATHETSGLESRLAPEMKVQLTAYRLLFLLRCCHVDDLCGGESQQFIKSGTEHVPGRTSCRIDFWKAIKAFI